MMFNEDAVRRLLEGGYCQAECSRIMHVAEKTVRKLRKELEG